MKITIKNIKKTVCFLEQEIEILHDVNMTCQSGEIIAIVGESGSGKSTLLNILSLLDECDSGEYYWDDVDIWRLTKEQRQKLLAHNIGIVFQQYNLINDMSCYDNVKAPLLLNATVKRKDREGLVDDALRSVGLLERKNHFPKTLSGGEQQRVSIARAIVKNPDIIFADEPTGNVDSNNEKQILQLFRDIANKGKIVLVVTHSERVKDFADRVYRMSDGILTEELS